MKRICISLLLALMALPLMAQTSYTRRTDQILTVRSDMRQYKYVYIIPSAEAMSSTTSYAVAVGATTAVGAGSTTTTAPTEIIASLFVKNGYTRLPQPVEELAEQTMIISYATTSSTNEVLYWRVVSTLQATDGKTHETVCIVDQVGQGADYNSAVKKAVREAMAAMLHIPSCASSSEAETLSHEFCAEGITPVIWPGIPLTSMRRIQDNYKAVIDSNLMSETLSAAYQEVMAHYYTYPSVEIANKIKAISYFASKGLPGKKAAKLDKRLKRTTSVEERLDLLYYEALTM